MSTTDLNTNNSAQTLFRFATMRNPELSDPKNKERRFIFRDYHTQKGVIDPRVEAGESLQKVCAQPTGLNIKKEQTLKEDDPAFYALAVWIARNKATASKTEFDKMIQKYKDYLATIRPVGIIDFSVIWDNLVYQVVTQKDFYAKETLMHFLHLNHILSVYDFTEEVYQDVVKAKVVLPKELFKASQSGTTGTSGSTTTQRTVYDNKAMKFAEATVNLKANEALADSISKLEKTYKKQYDATYKTAYDQYQNEVKPLLKSLQKDTAEADRKKQILENRINYLTQLSVADPEKFYANSELDMELHRIKDEIMQITMPETEIPDFEFSYKTPEIDAAILGRTLSVQDQNALLRLFGASSVTEALSGITTFDELSQNITQDTQVQQQTVLNNSILNQQVSANVGGVVIPVSNSVNSNGWIPYSVKTSNVGNNAWYIMLTIDGYTHNIVSGSYKVTINGSDISSTNIIQNTYGVHSLFYNGTTIPASQTTNSNGFVLQGEVVLDDGNTYSLSVTLTRDPNELNRILKQNIFKGDAALTLKQPPVTEPENPQNPENPTPTPTTNPANTEVFIPSGFGMKNIGITDYKRVEQSTYCYVEGEVAHIENIMAREYKERSTRRLKRSESQTTKSSESEKEKLTDTTSTERHEMQSEVAKILQESRDFAANAGFTASWGQSEATTGKYGLSVGANYATHNSKEESNRQAVTEAKDITARALDRIVTKVKEERIDKILEEFEENNKHGFDNTKGSSHVVGVYRWVDKVVKNQIYNYGKRMMFEFMIPEPAKIHRLGMAVAKSTENQLIKPIDPRSEDAQQMRMKDFSSLNGVLGETILKHWAGVYNVDLGEFPSSKIFLSKGFAYGKDLVSDIGTTSHATSAVGLQKEIEVPLGYNATFFEVSGGGKQYNKDGNSLLNLNIGNIRALTNVIEGTFSSSGSMSPISRIVALSISTDRFYSIEGNVTLTCILNQEGLQIIFNKIIEAYETELGKYNQALAEAKALGVQIKGSNPGFYRKIENTILRRNCISYMLNQNPNVDLTFGKGKYYNNGYSSGDETFLNTDIKLDGKLDQYAAFIKFMEQAFEWEIMSYHLYPYYWGERKSWAELYQFEDNDPIFRAFMQSGMARVIVTVRPGFEEAVRHFMATGQIWNGGEVPVIDDPLFLSLVDEMRSPKATKEGEPWREKIPTSLTILQADSIGLRVEKALPGNCEPGVKFDDNLGEMCVSNFELNNNQIGQSGDKWIEITFNEMDHLNYKNIGDVVFPRKYRCMDNDIVIERDASWNSLDSITKAYKYLAEEISQIEAVEAFSTGENGLTFRINVSKLKNFAFTKPGGDDGHDTLKFSVDLTNSILKISSPEYNRYGNERILDKNLQTISQTEYLSTIPLSRFLV